MLQLSSRSLLPAALVALLAATSPILSACDGPPASAPAGSAASLSDRDVERLLEALAQAPSHGFQPGAFGERGLAERVERGDRAAREQLRQAVFAYARALHGHAIPAKAFISTWGLKPPPYDPEPEFRQAVADDRLKAWIESLAPSSPQYQGLRAAYAAYQRIEAAGGWPVLEDPTPEDRGDLVLGARGPAVAALRGRLAVEEPAAAEPAPGDVFDPALAAALQRAQQRHGQHPTGVLDADTRAALNVPVRARLAQIRANLERLRWAPREGSPTRVEVNSAAGFVDVYRDGRNVLHMLAASGKPGDETPILASAIDRVVLNPTWNVPDTIAEQELLPKGAGYLQSRGFVHNPPGAGVQLTQQPGPQNALGQVKFLFDNRYAVYLHDTPSRAAFSREQRSVSHGCVRLARALDLAHLLLATEPDWSAERIRQTLASGETTEVKLSRAVPVLISYMTAFVGPGAAVSFRPDSYGWDAEVLRRLDAAGPGPA